jgi:hypothetical protein
MNWEFLIKLMLSMVLILNWDVGEFLREWVLWVLVLKVLAVRLRVGHLRLINQQHN